MFQAIHRICVALVLVFALSPQLVYAQAAKTIFAELNGQVLDIGGNPVANAIVYLDGPVHAQTPVDKTGHFVFANVVPGTYTLRITADGFDELTRTGVAVQNEDVNVDVQLSRTTALKEIGHVTTSSGRSAINVTAAPSYNLSPQDMAFQGQTSWSKVLEEVPGVSISTIDGEWTPDSPLSAAIVSIRGALSYETAELIDNMPLVANTQVISGEGVDLAAYNPQSFSAFDVVVGPGAQSPSIVDSIGGSLNLHPAGQVNQNTYSFSVQNDPYGGIIGNARAALRFKKLSATLSYSVDNSQGPLGANSRQLITSGLGNSIVSVDGNPFYCDPTLPCYTTSGVPPGYSTSTFYPGNYKTGIVGCCLTVPSNWSQHSGSVSLFYQLSPKIIVQAFYAGNSQYQSFPTAYYPTDFVPPSNYTGSVSPGTSSQEGQVFNSGSPVIESSGIYEGKLVFQLGQGQLQVAALNNNSWYIASGQFFPTAPLALQLYGSGCIASGGPSGPCPAGYAPMTFNGGTYSVAFPLCFVDVYSVTHNRDLSVNYATPLGNRARATVSYVRSYYDEPCNIFVEGSGFTINTPPQSNFEATDEYHLGLGFNPTDRLEIDLSGYLADADYHVLNPADLTQNTYVDKHFNYTGPRLSAVWRPHSDLAVRASAGGGFALAPLLDLVGTDRPPQFQSGGYYTQSLLNLALQPERSSSVDLGFDKRLTRDTILSFDVYRTNLYGQFYTNQQLAGTFNGSGGILPLYTTQTRNLAHSLYEGIELDLHRDVSRGVVWSLSGSLMRAYVVTVPAGFYNTAGGTCDPSTGSNCTNVDIIPGLNFNGNFTNVNVPYAQGFALYGYRWSPERFANIDVHYFGANNGFLRPAFVAFDANLQLPLAKGVALQGTFRNITGIASGSLTNYANGGGFPTISGGPIFLPWVNYESRALILNLSFTQ